MIRRTTVAALLVAFFVSAPVACKRNSDRSQPALATRVVDDSAPPPSAPSAGPDSAPVSGELVPPGSLTRTDRPADFAIYLAAPVAPSLAKHAADLVATRFPGLKVETKRGEWHPPTVVVFAPELSTYAPPTASQVEFFGRGLSPAEGTAVAASTGVLVFTWLIDADPQLARLRAAEQVVYDLAIANAGFVWDDDSREVYTTDAWRARRLETWEGDLPYAERNFAIHYYEHEGRHRAVTVGLSKFGLPDFTVRDVPLANANRMTTMISALAQLLIEGATVGPDGKILVDLTVIRHAAARANLLGASAPGALHRGAVTLAVATLEEGDSDNRLCELRFDGYPGATEVERQGGAIHAIVGAEADGASRAPEDDPELAAVAKRVQARLPGLAAAFRKGLPLGDRVDVKAPFATDSGGVEWMWITVKSWETAAVRGNLNNEPFEIKTLHSGAEVEVKQASIADYMWFKVDGTKEGGESSAILQRREERGK